MDNQKFVCTKTHTGENFTNKQLISQKVAKKQDAWKWAALIGAFLFQAIPYGVSGNIIGNMQPFVVNGGTLANGTTYGGIFDGFVLFTLVFTFGSLFSAVCTPLLGKLFGKVNLQVLLGVGNIVSGGAFAMIGLLGVLFTPYVNSGPGVESLYASRAAWLYAWYGICLVGTSVFSGLGIPFIIGAWFPGENRGTMLGIAFAGGSAGNLIWQVAINQTLKVIPVWDAFYIYGAVAVVVGVLISFLLVRTPKVFKFDSAQQSLGTGTTQLTKEQEIALNGAGLNTTLSIPWFYVLCISYGVFGLGIAAVASQWPTFLRSGLGTIAKNMEGANVENFLANAATIIGLVYGIGCLIGNLTGGIIFSKLGVAQAFIIGGVVRSIGALCMLLGVINPVLIAIGVGLSGFTCYTYTSATGFMSTNLFGRKDSSVVIGFLGIFFAIGFAISTPLVSAIQGSAASSFVGGYQMDGNWLAVWIFTAIVCIIGGLLVAFSANKIHKMGYVGMANANYSKYGMLIGIYSLPIYFKALKIWTSGKDERLTPVYLKLMNEKVKKWDAMKAEKIANENKRFDVETKKLSAKTQLKINKVQQQLNKVQRQISSLKLTDQQIAKNKQAVDKINTLITKEKNRNNSYYCELIHTIQTLNTNHQYDALVTALQNNTDIDVQYYNNEHIIKYFVKYAAVQMKILVLEQKLKVVQNPELYKLQQQEHKVANSLAGAQATGVFKQNRCQKTHEQIVAFYDNKYIQLNRMIDERVLLFSQHKEHKHAEKSTYYQRLVAKQNGIVTKTQDQYSNITKMWENNEIHSQITSLPNTTPVVQPAPTTPTSGSSESAVSSN